MEQITFKKGSLAVSSEISDDAPIYFLVSGTVRFSYCDMNGDIMHLGARVISKDQIFGHDAIAVGGTVRCSAVCESKAVCLTITPQSLEMVLKQVSLLLFDFWSRRMSICESAIIAEHAHARICGGLP